MPRVLSNPIFSSTKSYRDNNGCSPLLSKYNKIIPNDPRRPDPFRTYLEGRGNINHALTFLDRSEDDIIESTTMRRAMLAYIKQPTFETAQAFVAQYQDQGQDQDQDQVQHQSHDSSSIAPPSKRQKHEVAMYGGALPLATWKAFAYTDALHDLGISTKGWIMKNVDPSIIPAHAIKQNLTKSIANCWLKAVGMSQNDFTSTTHALMQRWAKTSILTLCFDGFLMYLQTDAPYEVFIKTLFETALVLIAFTESKMTITRLEIVDGFLQEVDGFYFDTFIKSYIDYLSLLLTGLVVVRKIIGIVQPKFMPVRINATRSTVELGNGTNIPYQGRFKDFDFHKEEDIFKFHLPFTKKTLKRMFKLCSEDPSEDVQRMLHAAVQINFVRDAYRIDLAIQNGWAFVTHDRLAFLYYSILANSENVQQLGFYGAVGSEILTFG